MRRRASRPWPRWAAAVVWVSFGLGLVAACLDRPIGAVDPITTNQLVAKINQSRVDKIDLLFMIDNSRSMSDKQAILRLAVPDLVDRLVNPVCVDRAGNLRETPAPGAPCPTGQNREFNPIEDIHVAVVSSSLGDAGANDQCAAAGLPGHVPERSDLAHLIGSLPRGADTGANAQGFLEWKAGTTDAATFSANFARMVETVGENGCGWEASLESWYRFLVDPFPYRELIRVACANGPPEQRNCVQPATDSNGNIVLDQTLLDQRAAFLRPDSLVAIIMLSDENDCSIQVGGTNWFVANTGRRMNRGSSACDADPNAKCCYTCGGRVPDGCAEDPVCNSDTSSGMIEDRLPAEQDGTNLRCFEQKRRFGTDLLYPTARYVNALTAPELCWSAPDLSLENCPEGDRARNPLYAAGRETSFVFLGGIIGVPWQSIASSVDANGRPLADPSTVLRFKTPEQLTADNTWDEILGRPGTPWRPAAGSQKEVAAVPHTPPTNPLMIESERARPGVLDGNPVNGREYDTAQGRSSDTPNDLQYACIFPLDPPRVCTSDDPNSACDCTAAAFDRPICELEPGDANPSTTQHWAKAYPGLRQLEVLRALGTNSIVASICARNVDITTRDTRPDFGYRPAMDAIVDRLKERLGGRCLPRALLTDAEGSVPCTLVETVPNPDKPCVCDASIAREPPVALVDALVRAELARQLGQPCGSDDPACNEACLCEVLQVQAANPDPAEALRACREDENPSGVEGWCYIANSERQQIGRPELVAECPPTQRQILRFVGQGLQNGTTTFVACTGASFDPQLASVEL